MRELILITLFVSKNSIWHVIITAIDLVLAILLIYTTDSLILGMCSFDIDHMILLVFNPNGLNDSMHEDNNIEVNEIELHVNVVNRFTGTVISSDAITVTVMPVVTATVTSAMTSVIYPPHTIKSSQANSQIQEQSNNNNNNNNNLVSSNQSICSSTLSTSSTSEIGAIQKLMKIFHQTSWICTLLSSHQSESNINRNRILFVQWQLQASQTMRGGC